MSSNEFYNKVEQTAKAAASMEDKTVKDATQAAGAEVKGLANELKDLNSTQEKIEAAQKAVTAKIADGLPDDRKPEAQGMTDKLTSSMKQNIDEIKMAEFVREMQKSAGKSVSGGDTVKDAGAPAATPPKEVTQAKGAAIA